MESGLVGRNNPCPECREHSQAHCLNGVRPSWPEQWCSASTNTTPMPRLNGVRPSWPEQYGVHWVACRASGVSMESGLVGRNNKWDTSPPFKGYTMSQWSPA